MEISDRLKEERERLGLTQTDMGKLGGAGKTTVIAWERGTAYPNAAYLAAIAAAGADVLYIVTGVRGQQPAAALPPEEAALLDNFRHCPPEARAAIKATSTLLAQPKGVKRKAG